MRALSTRRGEDFKLVRVACISSRITTVIHVTEENKNKKEKEKDDDDEIGKGKKKKR